MNKNRIAWITGIIVVPIIIYFYFLKWSHYPFHDDDLFILKNYYSFKTFFERNNLPLYAAKQYRPVFGLTIHFVIALFKKNILGYYLFNVAIQAINTLLFARMLNLFFKSAYLSILFSLILGLSRFAYYNMSQSLSGGALEGTAMIFFLLCLYNILIVFTTNDLTARQKQKGLLLSILFANLSMYTHERYIVLLPFIILIIIFSGKKTLNRKQKISLSLATLATIILPFIIKKYIYSLPIYMGTGFTTITFSLSSSISLFIQSVLSVFEINTGPDYLAGIQYSALPSLIRIFALVIDSIIIALFIFYMIKEIKSYLAKRERNPLFYVFICLGVLFFVLLIPGIVQIRLELRWYQASLSVLIIMVAIAPTSLQMRNSIVRKSLLTLFVFIFLATDYNYLTNGAQNLYFSLAARAVSVFYNAIETNTIKPTTKKLYIWEKHREPDRENEINWALADGYFFDFYANKPEDIVYVDSLYQKHDSLNRSTIIGFNKNTDQVVYLNILNIGESFDYSLTDITSEFLTDSLRSFETEEIKR